MRRGCMVAGTFAIAFAAAAEKPLGYVAPPAWLRFGRSLIFLGVIGGALAAALYLLQLWMHRADVPRRRRVRYWQIVALLVIAGALFAATDDQNDEGWNPALLGSFFLAPLLAVAIMVLAPGLPSTGECIAAVGLTPFFFFGLLWLVGTVQKLGFDLSW